MAPVIDGFCAFPMGEKGDHLFICTIFTTIQCGNMFLVIIVSVLYLYGRVYLKVEHPKGQIVWAVLFLY